MRTKSVPIQRKPPADFEEVKRRFIRQNRELAKNNSGQSLRIRSLELEVSRLLADNLELRNQVLHLQNEVYAAQKKASNSAARRMKEEMRARIAALSRIVDGIEDNAEDTERPPREKKPIEGNWRERQTLTELMRETVMPTISEDKLYPRRTLGAAEIQPIRLSDHSSNESPDLGPPPIAHFDYEDPVKTASPLHGKASPLKQDALVDEEVLPASLTVNLETRRKRKDGQPRLEIRRHSLLAEAPAKPEGEQPSILRTGAKRKLADRESDKPIKPPSKGDFTFSRKSGGDQPKNTENAKPSSAEPSDTIVVASPAPARKVLGDKSVNLSPRKAVLSDAKPPDKEKGEKPVPSRFSINRDASTSRRRRTSSIPVPSPPRDSVHVIELPPPDPIPAVGMDPTTPAALDLFSPTTSEPSAKPEGRGDTPPPSDMSSLSITTDGGRQPRRARSAVNYAEPSLIAKMRRPDKKMVDALTGLQDHRRAMSASGDRKTSAGPLSIKKEVVEESSEDWKSLPPARNIEPTSPLLTKSSTETLHQQYTDEAHLPTNLSIAGHRPSTSSATISALMAGSRRRRQSVQDEPLGTDIDAATKKLEDLDLYEFKESSSPVADASTGAGDKKAVRSIPGRTHRRHSSVPKDVGAFVARPADAKSEAVAVKTARLASRRRSMML